MWRRLICTYHKKLPFSPSVLKFTIPDIIRCDDCDFSPNSSNLNSHNVGYHLKCSLYHQNGLKQNKYIFKKHWHVPQHFVIFFEHAHRVFHNWLIKSIIINKKQDVKQIEHSPSTVSPPATTCVFSSWRRGGICSAGERKQGLMWI